VRRSAVLAVLRGALAAGALADDSEAFLDGD